MQGLPEQVYTPQYRAQAGRWVTEKKKSVPQAAREFGMSARTLANWAYKTRHDEGVRPTESRRPPAEVWLSLKRANPESLSEEA